MSFHPATACICIGLHLRESSIILALRLEALHPRIVSHAYLAIMVSLTSVTAFVSFHQFEKRFLSWKQYF